MRPDRDSITTMTLFEKIIAGEIPAEIEYEDDHVVAFRDIDPKAPTHILCVPRKPIPNIAKAEESDGETLGKLLLAGKTIAQAQGIEASGYRLVINCGPDGGETVPHLHLHILGGRKLSWPPG